MTAILLMPPVILIFAVSAAIAGIPLILVYIFGVWATVIAAAFLLARRLGRPAGGSAGEEPPGAVG